MPRKFSFWITLVVLLMFAFTASTALAQGPDKEPAPAAVEGQQEDSSVSRKAPDGAPQIEVQDIDLDNLVTPDGQQLPNPAKVEDQTPDFVRSLSSEQRAQIAALLEANQPTFMGAVQAPDQAAAADPQSLAVTELSPEQVQEMDRAGRAWIESMNAGIRSILTPEQADLFDKTQLPHPADWDAEFGLSAPEFAKAPETQTHCYYAYYYDLNYTRYYAYYAYYYAYYFYASYSDPYAYPTYVTLYYSYYYTYDAYAWAYYAYYYYYNSTYAYYAYYYSTHVLGLSSNGYNLAYITYTWNTSSSYAYYAYYYAYYAYYYSKNYGSYYAYYCYAG
jgi:hypothetical protein